MKKIVTFDSNVYSINAVKKAAYKFSKSFSILINIDNTNIHCELSFADDLTNDQCEQYVDLLKKEILDQDLREIISKETESVRNLILAHAFSKTDLSKNE